MALIDRERLVCIGKVSAAHGLEGEIKVLPLTSNPRHYAGQAEGAAADASRALRTVLLDTPRGLRQHTVERIRLVPGHWLVRLDGVADRSAAEALRGAELLVEPEQLAPLAEGEYFTADLLGCAVVTESGLALGAVREVLEAGGGSMLRVTDGPKEVLVPLVAAIVKQVDVGRREIRIDPPPGLLDLNG